MKTTRRLLIMAIAFGLVSTMGGTALAGEGDQVRTEPADRSVDRPVDRVVDGLSGESSDRPTERPTDKPSDRPVDNPSDRPTDSATDRCRTGVGDRYCTDVRPEYEVDRCVAIADNPRRCIADHPDDLNIRKLIWRLIHAHEWEKLVRLLHYLGWL